jgi:hypothetical protein
MQCVYLLREIDLDEVTPTGLYKIGMTTQSTEQRKRQYQAGNPRRVDTFHTIQVTDAQSVETDLHRRFAQFRVYLGGGDEWFFFGDVNIHSVIAIMDEYDETPVYVPPSYSHAPSHSSYGYDDNWFDNLPVIGIGLLIVVGLAFGSLGQLSPGTSTQIIVPQSSGNTPATLRSEPQFGDEFIIGYLGSGEQVTAYEVSPDGQWRRVRLQDGKSGWVANNLVQ